jgi:hypothetical protein
MTSATRMQKKRCRKRGKTTLKLAVFKVYGNARLARILCP